LNCFVNLATLPEMWDRTITIGSVGKTFSVTGWKLGWTIGPEHLLKSLCIVHQNCNYCCPTPLQVSVFLCYSPVDFAFGFVVFLCFHNYLCM